MIKKFKNQIIILIFFIFGGGYALADLPTEPPPEVPQTIEEKLEGKTPKQKVSIKGDEIVSKVQAKLHKRSKYDIEITKIQKFEFGIELFARVFEKNGEQIGFGKDGTVDIERFRIHMQDNGFNNNLSWMVVEDPNGTIVSDYVSVELDGSIVTRQKKYKEDPETAFLDYLELVISLKQQKFSSENIIFGKVGNTSSSFVSNAGGDGYVRRTAQPTWADARDNVVGTSINTVFEDSFFQAGEKDAGNFYVVRMYFPFDTAALPDGDTIASATLGIRQTGSNGEGDRTIGLIQTSQVSNTSLVVGDFDALTLDSPEEGASRVTMSTQNTDHVFTLNSTGLGWIIKTGFTNLGLRGGTYDIDDAAPTVRNYTKIAAADHTTAAFRPTLVVEHSAVGGDYNNSQIW